MWQRKWKRGMLAGAGLCLSGLVGCQAPGTQFASPFAGAQAMDHPNMPAMMPASPAFSRVQAGQNLPMMQPGMMPPQQQMQMGYPQGMPQMQMGYPQGMVQQQQQQPVMGSGGMVYPVAYQQPGMMPPQQQMPMAPQYPQQYPQQYPPQTFAPPSGPATLYTPAAPVTPAPAPQPNVSVIQGPNGPITVTTEIFDQPPPAQGGAPTFSAPAPYTVPMPEAPALPPASRAPEPLPPALGRAPAGPTLPGLTAPAGLGTYPAVPVGHQQIVTPPAKLPAPVGAPSAEDDIPSAPVFLK